MRRRADGPVADGLVERGRLWQWPDPELSVEGPDAISILPDGRGWLAGTGVRLHEQAMGRLMQRVEVQPAATRRDRVTGIAVCELEPGQPLEGAGKLTSVVLPLGQEPLVERLAVAEGEAVHECAAVEGSRTAKGGDASTTRRVGIVAMASHPGEGRPERRDVEVDGTARERDRRPVDLESPIADCRIEDRQGPAQGASRPFAVGLRPQERGEDLAGRRSPGRREIREDRDRLPGVDSQRFAVDADVDRPEQPDDQTGRHGGTVLRRTVLP